MKASVLACSFLIFPWVVSAGEPVTIALKDGTVLENVTLSRKDGLGVSIRWEDGIRLIPFSKMTDDSKNALGYDEAWEAEQFAKEEARKQQYLQDRAKEVRWSNWHEGLKQMKDHLLYEPVSLRQQGASNAVVENFLFEQGNDVRFFEEKFHAARLVIAAEEEAGASEDEIRRLIQAMLEGTVFVGMPEDAALLSWGPPTRKSATLDGGGRSEEWVYRRGRGNAQCISVSNGQVTSISERSLR